MTKVKKWIIFSALSILALSLLQGVSSYSSANIRSPAVMSIVDPENALIAIPDGQTIDVTQGNTTSKLKVKNNMAGTISVNAVGTYSDSSKSFTISGSSSLDPGNPVSSDPEFPVSIVVTTGTITGTVPVEVTFKATWSGGSAEIKNIVNVIGAAVKLSAPVSPKQELANPVSQQTAKPTATAAEDSKNTLINSFLIEPDKPIIEEVPITQVNGESNTYPAEKPPVQELPISPQQETLVTPSEVQGNAQKQEFPDQLTQNILDASASAQVKSQLPGNFVLEQPVSDTAQPVVDTTMAPAQQGTQPSADIVQVQSSTNTPQIVEGAASSSGQESTPAQGQTTAPVSAPEGGLRSIGKVYDT